MREWICWWGEDELTLRVRAWRNSVKMFGLGERVEED